MFERTIIRPRSAVLKFNNPSKQQNAAYTGDPLSPGHDNTLKKSSLKFPRPLSAGLPYGRNFAKSNIRDASENDHSKIKLVMTKRISPQEMKKNMKLSSVYGNM